MKTTQLTAFLASVALLAAGTALAEDSVKHNAHSHQFMSKRPYQQTVANKAQDTQWEGATYIADQELKNESHLKHQQAFRLHNLGKRAF
jgi:hypothetical protein